MYVNLSSTNVGSIHFLLSRKSIYLDQTFLLLFDDPEQCRLIDRMRPPICYLKTDQKMHMMAIFSSSMSLTEYWKRWSHTPSIRIVLVTSVQSRTSDHL